MPVMLSDRITNHPPLVLVVDDSPELRRYLRILLELESYRVETASTGVEALRLLRDGLDAAVILLDVQMPGIDGLATLRQLKKIRPDARVIMCSGMDDARTVRRARQLGAQAYLTKPVQQLYLSAAVERCLGNTSRADYSSNAVLTVIRSSTATA